MKKKVYFLMLTLVTAIASLSLSSCGNDDDPQPLETYYLKLVSVETNLVNPQTGESLASAYRQELISATELNSSGVFKMGKDTRENAEKAYRKNLSTVAKTLKDGYVDKNLIPEDGYIVYDFSMYNESKSYSISSSIVVTNTTVSIN